MISDYIEKMREQLKDRNLKEVSKNIEISYYTLWKFAKKNHNLNSDNLIKIDNYLGA